MKALAIMISLVVCFWGNAALAQIGPNAFWGDLSDFGACTLKFIRMDGDQYYRDVNEALIAVNLKRRNGFLVQLVKERLNMTKPSEDEIALDFKVYEDCAVTIAFNLKYF